jgi:hypothetical protein
MTDAKQLRLEFERAFRLARAGCYRFADELNDLGWNLRRQAQKVEQEASPKRRACARENVCPELTKLLATLKPVVM